MHPRCSSNCRLLLLAGASQFSTPHCYARLAPPSRRSTHNAASRRARPWTRTRSGRPRTPGSRPCRSHWVSASLHLEQTARASGREGRVLMLRHQDEVDEGWFRRAYLLLHVCALILHALALALHALPRLASSRPADMLVQRAALVPRSLACFASSLTRTLTPRQRSQSCGAPADSSRSGGSGGTRPCQSIPSRPCRAS